MRLEGSIALVSGGARRLGKEIALELAKSGVSIALHYHRSVAEAAKTRKEILEMGVSCRLYRADLSSSSQTLNLAKRVLKDFKKCPILVNSASVFTKNSFKNTKAEDLDEAWRVNLQAPVLLTKTIGLFHHKKKIPSRIINIGDASVGHPGSERLAYLLSKAALHQLTLSTAQALAPWVLVNTISPGPMLMPDKKNAIHKKESLKRTLLKKTGGTKEIARAVIFLAQSNYATGSELLVDGGRKLSSFH